jgi:glutamine synthetase
MTTTSDPTPAAQLSSFLGRNGTVRYIHYTVVTLFGTLECQVLPVKRCQDLIETGNKAHTVSPFSLWGGFGSPKRLANIFRYGSDLWYPDWTSLRTLDLHNASVMCNVSESATHHRDVDPDDPYHRCPRTGLQKVLRFAKEQHGLTFLAGFELEFYLLEQTQDNEQGWRAPKGAPGCYWSSPVPLRGALGACLVACVEAVQVAGIQVEHFHGNFSPNQCEIALSPLPAFASVDAMVQAVEIVKRTAQVNGFHATFHPKPFSGLDSCGSHAHVSMVQSVSEATSDHFLAGIMRRLEILCGIGMPFEAASRIEPETCGEWQAWGTNNKDVPVRKVRNGWFELRCIDYMSNMYLVLSSYIAAGLLGMEAEEPLEQKDCLGLPSLMSDDERQSLGIVKRLPSSSTVSLVSLEKDCMGLDEVVGKRLLEFFINVRQTDTKDDWKILQLALY